MERKFPHLCQPLTLGKVTFRNRMFSAPMGGHGYHRRLLYRTWLNGFL